MGVIARAAALLQGCCGIGSSQAASVQLRQGQRLGLRPPHASALISSIRCRSVAEESYRPEAASLSPAFNFFQASGGRFVSRRDARR